MQLGLCLFNLKFPDIYLKNSCSKTMLEMCSSGYFSRNEIVLKGIISVFLRKKNVSFWLQVAIKDASQIRIRTDVAC